MEIMFCSKASDPHVTAEQYFGIGKIISQLVCIVSDEIQIKFNSDHRPAYIVSRLPWLRI